MYKKLILTAVFTLVFLVSATLVISGNKANEKPIIFDHGYHLSEVGLSCDACHSGIENLEAGSRLIPDHDVCSDCHDVEDDETCGTCHRDPESPEAMPASGVNYLGFSHDKHLSQDNDCARCHSSFETAGMNPQLPEMSDCQNCHHVSEAPLNCTQCHLGKTPMPMDHQLVTWPMDHGMEASIGSSECTMCHEQASCDECHQGVNIYGKPHPLTWLFNHFAESSFGGECMRCHESRDECVKCHRVMRPIPHEFGPAYANRSNGGAHVTEAKDFIEVCLSCHDVGNAEPTCIKCHD